MKLLQSLDFLKFIDPKILVLIDKIILALLILLGTQILVIIMRKFIFSKIEKSKKELPGHMKDIIPLNRSLFPILRGIITTVLYTIGISLSLETLGIVSKTSILALFGSMGLGVGFAVKDIVSNAVSGIILLVSHLFELEDYIECKGTAGTIKEISVLTTKLETKEGIFVSIPNTMIYTNPISNYTANKRRCLVFTVPVEEKQSLEKAMGILNQLLREESRFVKNPPPQIFVSDIQNHVAQLQLRAWTLREDYENTYHDNLKKLQNMISKENIDL